MDIILGPIFSLFSIKFYRRIANSPPWKGVLYVAYLSLIGSIIGCLAFNSLALPVIDNFASWFVDNMPEIEISSEGISTPVDEPYEMIHPQFGRFLTLDTRLAAVDFGEMKDSYIFIAKENVYVRSSETEYRVYNIRETIGGEGRAEEGPFLLTPAVVWNMYKSAIPWALPIIFLFILLFVFIYKIIAALIYSLVALAINQLKKEKLKYPSLLNISCFALTPVFILQIISLLIPHFRVPTLLGIVLTVAYLVLALFG